MTTFPAPYRVGVYEELGKYVDLTVLFENTTEKTRPNNWFQYEFKDFQGLFLCDKSEKVIQKINRIRKSVFHKRFDAVILYEYSTLKAMKLALLCLLSRVPYLINGDGALTSTDGIPQNRSPIKTLIKRYFIRRATGYLASGRLAADYLRFYGAESESIYYHPFTSLYEKDIIKNPLSPGDKEKLRKELGLIGQRIVITASRFIHTKRIDILISAWENLPKDYLLVVAGSGDLEKSYKDQVSNLGLNNVLFPGFLEKETLMKFLKASDLFVFPTESDTWGLVVNEAMSCGLPVITTDKCVAGLELIIDGKNGFIFPSGDGEKLAKLIWHVLSDDHRLLCMGINSIETIKAHTFENVARSHMNAIRSSLKSKLKPKF